MAKTLDIGYFNSIFIKSDTFADTGNISNNRYYIEEARIKGGFNETSIDPFLQSIVNDSSLDEMVRESAFQAQSFKAN